MNRRTWTLTLPYRTPPLRDNSRDHWAVKAAATRQLRGDARVLAAHAKLPRQLHRVAIILHWQPAVRRRRDQLSIAPTLKPLVDGLVDYGLVPDDDVDHVTVTCRIHPPQPGACGALWLDIEELP
jgi:hypothetical protein